MSEKKEDFKGKTFLVTGGGGFLGKAIVKALLARGADVRSLSRSTYDELADFGVVQFNHDLGSSASLPSEALCGVSGIFHTAAYVKMWGKYQDFRATNIEGTRKLIDSAQEAGVKRLVFTSSPSVIARGASLCGVNESIAYPDHYEAFYPETKAEAERLVLESDQDKLMTCSLRPHLIFGPGDTSLTKMVVAKGRSGSLRRIGSGNNLVDFSYIEDCTEAHLLAMTALEENPASRGRSFFISQGDPYPLWKWIDQVLEYHDVKRVSRSVPYQLARRLAVFMEFLSKTFPVLGEPRLTRFLVDEMYTDHYFDITAAQEILGYKPRYTVDEALIKTFEQSKDKQSYSNITSEFINTPVV